MSGGNWGERHSAITLILKDSHEEGAYTRSGASAQGDAVKELAVSLSFWMGIV
jgi:hypothetical protein